MEAGAAGKSAAATAEQASDDFFVGFRSADARVSTSSGMSAPTTGINSGLPDIASDTRIRTIMASVRLKRAQDELVIELFSTDAKDTFELTACGFLVNKFRVNLAHGNAEEGSIDKTVARLFQKCIQTLEGEGWKCTSFRFKNCPMLVTHLGDLFTDRVCQHSGSGEESNVAFTATEQPCASQHNNTALTSDSCPSSALVSAPDTHEEKPLEENTDDLMAFLGVSDSSQNGNSDHTMSFMDMVLSSSTDDPDCPSFWRDLIQEEYMFAGF